MLALGEEAGERVPAVEALEEQDLVLAPRARPPLVRHATTDIMPVRASCGRSTRPSASTYASSFPGNGHPVSCRYIAGDVDLRERHTGRPGL